MGAAAFPVDRVTAREAPGPAAAVSTSELAQMRLLATSFMTRWGVPGMQVAIARADAIAYNAAFGLADATKATPLTTANLFRIASLSKPITSVAIYKLIEAGKLTLGSRVFGPGALLGTRYGSKPYSAALRSVTVGHLLTHTAGGWPNDAADPMFLFPSMTIQDLISWTLDNRPLTNVPGTSYAYSNFGYAVLGRVIETLSGKGYGSYVANTVLKPCGISAMKLAGNTLADRNVIAQTTQDAVLLVNAGASGSSVFNNLIGSDRSGSVARPVNRAVNLGLAVSNANIGSVDLPNVITNAGSGVGILVGSGSNNTVAFNDSYATAARAFQGGPTLTDAANCANGTNTDPACLRIAQSVTQNGAGITAYGKIGRAHV